MTDRLAKILLIEDEPLARESLADNLLTEGYEVFSSGNGTEGLKMFDEVCPDLVVLDVVIPGIDGLEVCRKMRALKQAIPIIMLTAKTSETDKVVGLELGADDYITKPFGVRELFARIRALLRRAKNTSIAKENENQDGTTRLEFDDVVVDFRAYRAYRAGVEIELSAKEFELLRFLSNQPDIPVTRGQLLDEVWGYNSYPTTRTVDNFIARLRQKIEQTPEEPRRILTVYGVGYKFVLNEDSK